jgi:hypothetical protein
LSANGRLLVRLRNTLTELRARATAVRSRSSVS